MAQAWEVTQFDELFQIDSTPNFPDFGIDASTKLPGEKVEFTFNGTERDHSVDAKIYRLYESGDLVRYKTLEGVAQGGGDFNFNYTLADTFHDGLYVVVVRSEYEFAGGTMGDVFYRSVIFRINN